VSSAIHTMSRTANPARARGSGTAQTRETRLLDGCARVLC
jgi:hypothetical protein